MPGEAIPYGRVGEILACPWHGWEYDLSSGRSLTSPDRVRVRTYPVHVEGGRVLIDLP
jgi:3-phenylpropionate/trans-cinnamate dioxygenase ferredoxin subunit